MYLRVLLKCYLLQIKDKISNVSDPAYVLLPMHIKVAISNRTEHKLQYIVYFSTTRERSFIHQERPVIHPTIQ